MLFVTLKTYHILLNQEPQFFLQALIFCRRFSLDSTSKAHQGEAKVKEEEEEVSSVLVSRLVLSHAGDAQTLTLTLLKHPNLCLSPGLVDRVLKHLWNDGPKALLFFHALLYHHPSYKPSASSFDHALDIAGRLRDRRTLHRLLSFRCKLRLPPTPRTFAIIMERFISAGKPDLAIRLFLSMHQYGCSQDLSSFNTLLDVLCKARRVEKACSIFKVFKQRFRADTISYNIIANGWCLIKRTPRALELLKEMVELGLEPTLTTYNILLRGFFRAGQSKEAWNFFLQMKKRSKEGLGCGPDVVSYTTVVHGLGLDGQVLKSRQVFEEMILHGCLPSVATYNALIQVVCKKDSVENALLVFRDMLRKGYIPNSTTYNLLIRGLCHAGEMDRAVELLEGMKYDECVPNVQTYNVLIRYYSEAGQIEKGLDLFGKMGECESCLPNLDTYNVMISAMFVRKRQEDMLIAGKLLAEMVDRGHLPRRFTFNRVLNGLILTGNQAFARELLRVQSRCRPLLRKIRL